MIVLTSSSISTSSSSRSTSSRRQSSRFHNGFFPQWGSQWGFDPTGGWGQFLYRNPIFLYRNPTGPGLGWPRSTPLWNLGGSTPTPTTPTTTILLYYYYHHSTISISTSTSVLAGGRRSSSRYCYYCYYCTTTTRLATAAPGCSLFHRFEISLAILVSDYYCSD